MIKMRISACAFSLFRYRWLLQLMSSPLGSKASFLAIQRLSRILARGETALTAGRVALTPVSRHCDELGYLMPHPFQFREWAHSVSVVR